MSRSPHLPLDSYCRGVLAEQPDAIVAWWLMASWLYYVGFPDNDYPGEPRFESLLTDEYFDELSRDLLARWAEIRHPHKHLINREMLQAGTGFTLHNRDYPSITKGAALQLVRHGPQEPPAPTRTIEEALAWSPPSEPAQTIVIAHASDAASRSVAITEAIRASIDMDAPEIEDQGELF